jgi:hypothetical protein
MSEELQRVASLLDRGSMVGGLMKEHSGMEGIGAMVRHSDQKISFEVMEQQSHFKNKLQLQLLREHEYANYATQKKD